MLCVFRHTRLAIIIGRAKPPLRVINDLQEGTYNGMHTLRQSLRRPTKLNSGDSIFLEWLTVGDYIIVGNHHTSRVPPDR